MPALYIVTDIKHNPCEEINYQWETNGKKGRINEKQPDLRDRNIKALAKVGANTKRVTFKKGQYSL